MEENVKPARSIVDNSTTLGFNIIVIIFFVVNDPTEEQTWIPQNLLQHQHRYQHVIGRYLKQYQVPVQVLKNPDQPGYWGDVARYSR